MGPYVPFLCSVNIAIKICISEVTVPFSQALADMQPSPIEIKN